LSGVLLFAVLAGAAQTAGPVRQFPDRPQQREDWFMRFRQSRDDQSPAAHRFAAFQHALSLPTLHRRRTLSAAALSGAAPAELGGDWTELGPKPETDPSYGNIAGRITALALDGSTLYAGAADGGLWVSQNPTAPSPTFTPIGDNLPSLSIGAIAVDSTTTPHTIYVGTGEPNGSQDSYYGVGVLKSTDGGQTWTLGGGNMDFTGSAIFKLIVDPVNPQILLAAVTESGRYATNDLTPSAPAIGIVRSTDGGATWQNVLEQGAHSGTDLTYISGIYYAAIRGVGMFKSADQGATWQAINSPVGTVTATNFYRVSLATRGSTLYALIVDTQGLPDGASDCASCTGLADSIDGGNTWSSLPLPSGIYGSNNQGAYDQFVAAPAASTSLVVGGIDVWTAAAGNSNWTNLTNAYTLGTVHPDEHAFVAVDSTHWYIGNDGGVWYTADAGASWSNLNATIGAIQFYSVSADQATAGRLWGGSQDNGTALAQAGTPIWISKLGGDGGYTAINPSNPQQLFAENFLYSLQRSDDGGATFSQVITGALTSEASEFYVPYVLAPGSSGLTYLAAQSVWRGPAKPDSPNQGWQAISGNLTHPQGNLDPSGDDLTAIAVAPSSADVVYAGAYDGSLSVTQNATDTQSAQSWTNPHQEFNFNGPVTAIAVSAADPNTVYWGLGFIGRAAVLYKSTDGGKTAVNIAGNLPGTPINAIVLDAANPDAIYVATDVGVFAAGDGGAGATVQGVGERWARIGDNLPAAGVLSLALTNAGGTPTLVAGTHGRGAWSIPAQAPGSFTMTVTPATQNVEAGQPATYTVQTTVVGGSSTIALTCTGITGGVSGSSCTITPASIPAGQSATLTLNAAAMANNPEYQTTFTVTGDNGFAQQSQSLALNTLDFLFGAATVPPNPLPVEAGASTTVGMAVDLFSMVPNGTLLAFDAPVAFSCPNAPAGITCTFTPANIPAPSATTKISLQIQVAASAASGPQSLDVRAVGGSLTRDDALPLQVTDFTVAAAPSVLTVINGTPAVFSITAPSASGFTGSISLSCAAQFGAQGTCAFNPASIQPGQTSTLTLSGYNQSFSPFSSGADWFLVSGASGGSVSSAQISVDPQDFALSEIGRSLTTIPGSSGMTLDLGSRTAFGYAVPIALSCSGAAGLTCAFSPSSLVPGAAGTVTIGGMAGLTPSSSIPLTITGTSGALVHTVPLTLRNDGDIVYSDNLPGAVAPVLPGDPVTFRASAVGTNNYTQPASVACAAGVAFSCAIDPIFGQVTVIATGAAPGTMTVPLVISTSDGGATITKNVESGPIQLGDFSMQAASTATIFPGNSANLALTFTNTPNTGSYTLKVTCSSLPATVTCTPLTTNTFTGGQGQATVNLVLQASGGASAPPLGERDGGGTWLLLAAGGFLLWIAARRRPRWALVGGLALASFACGGGGGGAGGGGGGGAIVPPVTSSTVTVTATDATLGAVNPVSHSATFELTVE